MNNDARTMQQIQATTAQYGVSPPICTKFPAERDLRLTREVCI